MNLDFNIESIAQTILISETVYVDVNYHNPQLLSFIILLSVKLGKPLTVYKNHMTSGSRLGLLGLRLNNSDEDPTFSLRRKLNEIIKIKESNVKIFSAETFKIVSDNYSKNYFCDL